MHLSSTSFLKHLIFVINGFCFHFRTCACDGRRSSPVSKTRTHTHTYTLKKHAEHIEQYEDAHLLPFGLEWVAAHKTSEQLTLFELRENGTNKDSTHSPIRKCPGGRMTLWNPVMCSSHLLIVPYSWSKWGHPPLSPLAQMETWQCLPGTLSYIQICFSSGLKLVQQKKWILNNLICSFYLLLTYMLTSPKTNFIKERWGWKARSRHHSSPRHKHTDMFSCLLQLNK